MEVPFVGETHHLQHIPDPPLYILGMDAHDALAEGDVLEDRAPGEELEILKDKTYLAPQPWYLATVEPPDVATGHQDLAPVRLLGSEEDFKKGRLSRTAGPGDEDELPGPHLEGYIPKRVNPFAVALVKVKNLDHRGRG